MPFRHRYQTYEVRRLLQQAEHQASPVTGAGAHSRGLHSLATPGGVGTTTAAMLARTHKVAGETNGQFRNRGGTRRTSAFKNVLQQADAVCQALNSATGQTAMGWLDAPLYAARNLRVILKVGPIREAGFLPATPASSLKTVGHTDAAVRRPAAGAVGVQVIIDRAPGQREIHIQTCYPLETLAHGNSYVVTDAATRARLVQG